MSSNAFYGSKTTISLAVAAGSSDIQNNIGVSASAETANPFNICGDIRTVDDNFLQTRLVKDMLLIKNRTF